MNKVSTVSTIYLLIVTRIIFLVTSFSNNIRELAVWLFDLSLPY